MDFAANFTAIDFETANRRADSACQLAAVRVRDGEIVASEMWMIRPEPFFFSPGNIRIHGILPDDVRHERTFGEIWSEVTSFVHDDCLVAHNAAFDIGVLLACLTRHQQFIPDLHFTCTRAIARRCWPKRPRYGLKPLSDWLGVRFRHHDALEDSIACAKILMAAGMDQQAECLEDLEAKLKLSRGSAGSWGKKTPQRIVKRSRRSQRAAKTRELSSGYTIEPAKPLFDIQRLLIRADFIRPLSGQSIVFAGTLRLLTNQDAEMLTLRSGGECQPDVDTRTSLLVVGGPAEREPDKHNFHVKQAERLQSEGHSIRVVGETEFLELVGQGVATQ